MNGEPEARRPATGHPGLPDGLPDGRPITQNNLGDALPSVDSQALLQGHNTLLIHHLGEVYRLQHTRQGKLILTK